MREYNKLIFELSKEGRVGYSLPKLDVDEVDGLIPEKFLKTEDVKLPEVSENEVVRHYTKLSNKNYGLDAGFYPLGSCTMKYNPKINERVAEDVQMTALQLKNIVPTEEVFHFNQFGRTFDCLFIPFLIEVVQINKNETETTT